MNEIKPGTTPAPAATLPNALPNNNLPATPAPGQAPAGTVTIPLTEYRNLQRADARAKSFDRRNALGGGVPPVVRNADGSEPSAEVMETLNQAKAEKAAAEKRTLQLEVKGAVRDLLEKPEYAALPKSTKDLILKNPAMLSEASTLEEALIDIEDFVGAQVLNLNLPAPTTPGGNPPGHDTPPAPGGGPAPVRSIELEDTSKMTGPKRSVATIKNLMKAKK